MLLSHSRGEALVGSGAAAPLDTISTSPAEQQRTGAGANQTDESEGLLCALLIRRCPRAAQQPHHPFYHLKQNLLLLEPHPLPEPVVPKIIVDRLLSRPESRQILQASILRGLLCPQLPVRDERVVIHEKRLCVRPLRPQAAEDGKAV